MNTITAKMRAWICRNTVLLSSALASVVTTTATEGRLIIRKVDGRLHLGEVQQVILRNFGLARQLVRSPSNRALDHLLETRRRNLCSLALVEELVWGNLGILRESE